MKDKDKRDDIWDGAVSGWWLVGYTAGLIAAVAFLVARTFSWLGANHPALSGILFLALLGWGCMWLIRRASHLSETEPPPAISPSKAATIMPNDADFDTELRLLIISEEEQRRADDE